MQVVIMAGGAGTRLGKLTERLPKALLPFAGGTLLGKLLDQLAGHGMSEAILCVGPERSSALYNKSIGERWRGIPVRMVCEDEPLGTAGSLRLVQGLDTNFMVVNCDIVTDLDFSAFYNNHHDRGAAATVATGDRVETLRFGIVEASSEGHVMAIREKPELRHEILLGAYVLNRAAALESLPALAQRMDMPDLLNTLIARGNEVCRFHSGANWCDVGTPEDYKKVFGLTIERNS